MSVVEPLDRCLCNKAIGMDSYTEISKDIELAQQSILKAKKSLHAQKRSLKHILDHNQMLRSRVRELEQSNDELRQLIVLIKQNKKLRREQYRQAYPLSYTLSASESDEDCISPHKVRRLSGEDEDQTLTAKTQTGTPCVEESHTNTS